MSTTDGTALVPRPAPGQTTTQVPAPVVDLLIPVHNEAHDLPHAVARARAFLDRELPWPARLTIVDNASTDDTWAIARRLAAEIPGVAAVRLDRKGRGLALSTVWRADAAHIPVLAYMDVDLSTDLRGLAPLVAPLVSGHSDVAIGTRLARGSHVRRGPTREFILRSYNLLLHTLLGVRFSDAQCGFKAITADAARALLPQVHDTQWFFDTELLVIAEKAGLRIHEVPVDWVDDPDSRVDIPRTVREDLAGIARLAGALLGGRIPLEAIRQAVHPPMATDHDEAPHDGLLGQIVRFAVVGLASTVLYTLLLLGLMPIAGAQAANLLALLLSTLANTQANRWFTFGVHGRRRALVHQGQGLVVFLVGWLLTAIALQLTAGLAPVWQAVAATVANLLATLVKFLLFRHWVFRPHRPATTTDAGVGPARHSPARDALLDDQDATPAALPTPADRPDGTADTSDTMEHR
ncbi:MAG: Glycosyltransferase [Pseudoclavibacter caeni]|jgi:putative flippase GtrA